MLRLMLLTYLLLVTVGLGVVKSAFGADNTSSTMNTLSGMGMSVEDFDKEMEAYKEILEIDIKRRAELRKLPGMTPTPLERKMMTNRPTPLTEQQQKTFEGDMLEIKGETYNMQEVMDWKEEIPPALWDEFAGEDDVEEKSSPLPFFILGLFLGLIITL